MILLKFLCEICRICDLEGIHSTVSAGTMLGAIRRGDFIPWDDDADVALFRDTYEAFRAVCGKYLDTTRFYFQEHISEFNDSKMIINQSVRKSGFMNLKSLIDMSLTDI